jgi:hypothetical protein
MPNFSIFKIFQIFGIVSAWATKAFADGRVTMTEALELVVSLCAVLGLPTDFDIPNSNQTQEIIPDAFLTSGALPGEEKDLDDAGRPPPEEESPKLAGLK